jgi:chemosensory pili system protein ChpC
MLAVEVEEAAEISCVILPLGSSQLVVPAACVAEVLPWRRPTTLAGAPRWCAGALDWHGAVIPVVDHEALVAGDAAVEPAAGRCLAVINRTRPDSARPFYALVVHGIPRLVLVAQMDLSAEQASEGPGELLRIHVGTEQLVIPDLALLEMRVDGLAPASGASSTHPG